MRATVRVLLRGLPPAEGAQRSVEGYMVLLTGAAIPDHWPNAKVLDGDLEGMVWTTPRQVTTVMRNLSNSVCVIDTKGIGSEPPPP
ncbi:MAG: hypothetical protein NVSMB1_15930 [Polyangiales bacterium]